MYKQVKDNNIHESYSIKLREIVKSTLSLFFSRIPIMYKYICSLKTFQRLHMYCHYDHLKTSGLFGHYDIERRKKSKTKWFDEKPGYHQRYSLFYRYKNMNRGQRRQNKSIRHIICILFI